MSIIENAEKYMKRYDYLIQKRERKYRERKRLSPEEDEELRQLRPNVFTPIFMMFELLHDTVKTNQEHRQLSNRIKNQTGGATPSSLSLAKQSAVVDAAVTVAAVVASQKLKSQSSATDPPTDAAAGEDDHELKEARRLSELEESLLPLLTKIILYIEENKKAEKKKDGDGDEDEKYPDIGTTAKNSAILVVRRIKKWWNDLVSGGTSDLSSKINLKKMIPQLANNPTDMNNLTTNFDELNKLADKATDAIHGPLQKIERILSNDVRDIASSSVEGIMNALSLIPGIGTTLQLWRLLQNVIVIMSKSVTTMAKAKETGGELKVNVQGLADDFQKMTDPNTLANAAANKALGAVANQAGAVANQAGALANQAGALGGGANPLAALTSGGLGNAMDIINKAGGVGGALGALNGAGGFGGAVDALKGAGGVGGALGALNGAGGVGGAMKGGGAPRKMNHLRSIKKYKREYKQSIREIRKTRKNILRCIKNMI